MSGFRKVCRFLHREFGFLAVGLTIVYAVSGVAVNHIESWNPNYSIGVEITRIQPVPQTSTPEVTAMVLDRLNLREPIKNVWRESPDRIRVIVEGATLDVQLGTGEVVRTGFIERPVLMDFNFLHLNHGKGIWTWIADVYALLLCLLALTGIFLARGRKGLAGRGGVWLGVGIALPLIYIVTQRYL